jgi:hypothetical protein
VRSRQPRKPPRPAGTRWHWTDADQATPPTTDAGGAPPKRQCSPPIVAPSPTHRAQASGAPRSRGRPGPEREEARTDATRSGAPARGGDSRSRAGYPDQGISPARAHLTHDGSAVPLRFAPGAWSRSPGRAAPTRAGRCSRARERRSRCTQRPRTASHEVHSVHKSRSCRRVVRPRSVGVQGKVDRGSLDGRDAAEYRQRQTDRDPVLLDAQRHRAGRGAAPLRAVQKSTHRAPCGQKVLLLVTRAETGHCFRLHHPPRGRSPQTCRSSGRPATGLRRAPQSAASSSGVSSTDWM